MHPNIALYKFEDEWPSPTNGPTFLGSNAKYCYHDDFRFPSPIYTQFDPVMHHTIALNEFEDEWPWPTFLGHNAKTC